MKSFCVYCGIDLALYSNPTVCPNCSGPTGNRTAGSETRTVKPISPNISAGSSKSFCHQCGTALISNAKFCQSCGAPVLPTGSPATDHSKKRAKESSKRKIKPPVSQPVRSPLYLILGTVGIGLIGLFALNNDLFKPHTPSTASSSSSPLLTPENAERMKQYQNELAANPDHFPALVSMGNLLFDAKNFSEAIPYYQRALKLQPENADVRVDLGVSHFYLRHIPVAIQETERALRDNPRHINAHYNLGIMYSAAGNSEKARQLWKKTMELAPGSPIAKSAEQNIQQLSGMPVQPASLDGHTLYEMNCSTCHELIDPQKYKAGEWPAFVEKYGTFIQLTEPEKQKIIEYLSSQTNP